jgi:hypothetical protein
VAQDIASLIANFRPFRDKALEGAAAGLDAAAERIEEALHGTKAHGDASGATRAAYAAWRVGRGENGTASLASSVAAGEALNPGATATGTVAIDGELGVIISDPMEYGPDRETGNAGDKATIGPAIAAAATPLTAAAAEGSRRALS